jgi:uncharacterized hydrophobic protein (TIGR00271 family)
MGILRNIIDDNKFTPEDLPAFEAKLFFEGAKRRVDLERFVVLLFLSTVIAIFGVIGDSVATVIGAMIIAPLMRPIMATAAALVMGDMKRAGSSFLVVLASVAGVIGTAWLLTELSVFTVISIESNFQFSSRISPGLIDLYAALASGAAGAFAMSRKDVSDSLPGVAIAIWGWRLSPVGIKRCSHQRIKSKRPPQCVHCYRHRHRPGRYPPGGNHNKNLSAKADQARNDKGGAGMAGRDRLWHQIGRCYWKPGYSGDLWFRGAVAAI